MVQLRLVDLKKCFGDAVAVDSINLTIASGEFVVLLGPSGCGKTTTLRMIAGLESVTSGRIFIGDRDVAQVHARDRDVAMVFQSYALYPHMTVDENLSFALRLRKMPRSEIERRVHEVSVILKLEALLKRKPRNLSGGQQQRVALGRAMVREPAVFLFDEPLSNLDAKLRSEMRSEIVRLHRTLDATMVYVTHDQVEAMTMADRIVVMNHGHIQQIGTPLEIYDDPVNLFVAGFIGLPAMNTFDASVESGDRLRVVANEMLLELPSDHAAAGLRTAKFGVRPESLTIDSVSGVSGIVATIESVEHLGSETLLIVSTGGPTLTIKSPRNNLVRRGDAVRIRIDPAQVFVFDAISGARVRKATS